MRKVVSAVALAVGMTMVAAPAFADPPLDIHPRKVRPGDKIEVGGRCKKAGTVRVTLDGELIFQTKTKRNGRFSGKGTVPDVDAGRQEVRAMRKGETCGDEDITVERKKPRPGQFTVSPRKVEPGDTVSISGSGCKGTTKVSFFLGTRKIGSTTSRKGFFQGSGKIPSNTDFGKYTVSAVCNNQVVGSARIRVVDDYPGKDGRASNLAVSQSTVTPGRTVALTASPCEGGTTDASLNDTRLVLASPVRSGGVFKANTTIPQGTKAGTYTLATRCNGRMAGVATIHVVSTDASEPVAARTALPSRRTNLVPGLGIGVALIIAGGLVLYRIKRHRRGRHAA
jgi:hypothetical protein